ncbi:MAG: hypothetical protein JJ992_13765, partial [Planctomycetes bacterium]|nr:hypothetical protein [Planctomycetota bacterium]
LLQESVSKLRIRFLLAGNTKVHEAIKRRGELWRITPEAVSIDDMTKMIRGSQMGIGGRPIYYHCPCTGTRMLTIQGLRQLGYLDDEELRQHLLEIQKYISLYNRKRHPEVDFFLGSSPLRKAFREADFVSPDGRGLRELLAEFGSLFAESVPPHLRQDDPRNVDWRRHMCEAICPLEEDTTVEEEHVGMAPEFHRHVQWLSGGRIEQGLLVFDPIYEAIEGQMRTESERLKYQRAREILFNFVRDHPDLEYINGGRIIESLSLASRKTRGHRDVYVFQMKHRGQTDETIKIVRVQKWDVRWRLDHEATLEQAMIQTEEYTEYTRDRELGCRRLGMNLGGPVVVGKLEEKYERSHPMGYSLRIWTPYFERDYVRGVATDKVPEQRFTRPDYCRRFARLLGQAAAANLIVGRGDEQRVVFFDDGDEVIIEDDQGLPDYLLVTHHTGSFWHFQTPLMKLAPAYARPVNARVSLLLEPADFAREYLAAFTERFAAIQRQYRSQRTAFDQLFHFREVDPKGNFAFRWACVLERLDATPVDELVRVMASHFQVTPEPAGNWSA